MQAEEGQAAQAAWEAEQLQGGGEEGPGGSAGPSGKEGEEEHTLGVAWVKLLEGMSRAVIGADFLANFKIAMDLSGMQLLCPVGLKIQLEAPHGSSLTAACTP